MSSVIADLRKDTASSAGRGIARGALRRVVREPFFQFVALGALLFAASEYLEARSNFARIEISRAQVAGIAANYQLQYGAAPSSAELDALVEQFIKEEVFYHEALRLKLDRDDEIVRRRLVQKYEFLQQDLGTPGEPVEADLRAFYATHAGNYEIPEKLSFSHVFFAVDGGDDQSARNRAQRVLALLQAQKVSRAPQLGDGFPGQSDYAGATAAQVRRAFGAGSLSGEIFNIAPGHWSGPYRSGFGWHLVYVSAREPAHTAAYEEVRDAVQRDYLDQQRGLRNEEALAELKKHFTIVRE